MDGQGWRQWFDVETGRGALVCLGLAVAVLTGLSLLARQF
jgi:hypothetical protein